MKENILFEQHEIQPKLSSQDLEDPLVIDPLEQISFLVLESNTARTPKEDVKHESSGSNI